MSVSGYAFKTKRQPFHVTPNVEHFLISLALDRCAHLHVYLMTDDRRYLRLTLAMSTANSEPRLWQ
jgi:hypothetical protein